MSMFNPFTWLRRQAAEAVVLGVSDALKIVAESAKSDKNDAGDDDLRSLFDGQLKMLPAHVTDDTDGKRSNKK